MIDKDLMPTDFETVSMELANEHLFAFLGVFVVRSRQNRWLELAQKNNAVLYDKVRGLSSDLDRSLCLPIDAVPNSETGVYIDFLSYPHLRKGLDCLCFRASILSVLPGKLAYFISDDEFVLKCEK